MVDVPADPTVLCPMCGSENDAVAHQCSICGYGLAGEQNNAGGLKCARCGSEVPEGFAFCPVCGLDQRHRLARPPTRVVQIDEDEEDDDPDGQGRFVADSYPETTGSSAFGVGGASFDPPAKTGRTEFVQGPPIPRPPHVQEDARTIPVPGKPSPPPAELPLSPPMSPMPGVATPVSVEGPPQERPGAVARLVLVGRDGEEGESFPMLGPAVEVGRTHGDLRFPDDRFMSPAHARIERVGHGFRLVDTGSINGVFLRIRGHAPVYPSDLFMVGHQVLRLENVVELVQEQAPAPDGTRVFGTPLKPAWGKLVLVGRGAVAGDVYFLRGAKVVFGREHGDLLFPHDPFVSREHARLRLELHGHQMSVFLEDLGSANGTYIRVRGSVEIRPRDTFRVGDQILRLRLDP